MNKKENLEGRERGGEEEGDRIRRREFRRRTGKGEERRQRGICGEIGRGMA